MIEPSMRLTPFILALAVGHGGLAQSALAQTTKAETPAPPSVVSTAQPLADFAPTIADEPPEVADGRRETMFYGGVVHAAWSGDRRGLGFLGLQLDDDIDELAGIRTSQPALQRRADAAHALVDYVTRSG